ncbi:hypothetical protein [Actinoplanes sp. NPDC051494]|uniref:hypothetical protein n=1 Tax=Actinoplanes sp. NPDC051494 TaxID=3363907 RepID=UPI0037AD5344
MLEHLRQWSASHEEWSEMCDLQYKVTDLPNGPERAAEAGRMAELLESYADRLERSGLVRVGTTFTPEELRTEAAEYRAGRDPRGEAE